MWGGIAAIASVLLVILQYVFKKRERSVQIPPDIQAGLDILSEARKATGEAIVALQNRDMVTVTGHLNRLIDSLDSYQRLRGKEARPTGEPGNGPGSPKVPL